jgi:hypothetical protein
MGRTDETLFVFMRSFLLWDEAAIAFSDGLCGKT